MRLIIAASGSKANAAIIEYQNKAILIDCGVPLKTLRSSLNSAGLQLGDINAVFVTHSHSDHIKGLQTLRRAIVAPFYSAVEVELCEKFEEEIEIDGLKVSAFECSHDVPCVGYKIESENSSFCIATDSGTITSQMRQACSGCRSVMLESNHDKDMLNSSYYPLSLKSRILSPHGHLSNTDCADFITELASNGLQCAVLAHISENNNTPLLARCATVGALTKYGLGNKVLVANAVTGLIMEI